MTKTKKTRRPRKYKDVHLTTLSDVQIEVTPHIDADEYGMGEVIVLTGKDTRPNGREVELIFDEGEAEVFMSLMEHAIANLKARNP